MMQQQVKVRKKELEQSLAQDQILLKNVLEDMEKDLELKQDSFLSANVDHEKFIPKKQDEKI